jgi:hypothetical protein
MPLQETEHGFEDTDICPREHILPHLTGLPITFKEKKFSGQHQDQRTEP